MKYIKKFQAPFKILLPLMSVFLMAVQLQASPNAIGFELGEDYPGGKTSTKRQDANAYSLPSNNLAITKKLDFSVGNSFFRNPWVIAPASADARDGVGPLFNTNSCQSCHIKDGRGHSPEGPEDDAVSMLIRLSIPAKTKAQRQKLMTQGVIPEPNYGGQFQDLSNPGIPAEGRIRWQYEYIDEKFPDGSILQLRKPVFQLENLNYGPLHPETQFSPRVAPIMIGLGLLEQIPESTILEIADETDRNKDGISGRANRVWDIERKQLVLGRFGWKAGMPSLKQQNAGAFHGDLGVTSSLFSEPTCTKAQAKCLAQPDGGQPELSDDILQKVTFYTQHLAVPKRVRAKDPEVLKGKSLFYQVGCQDCHRPSMVTSDTGIVLSGEPSKALKNQKIWPYTDLLLHDLGAGLADLRGEFIADGQEWRTAPLWGMHALKAVNGHTQLLHDGRARNVTEAILWHAGEALPSKEKFKNLSKEEREALSTFVMSL